MMHKTFQHKLMINLANFEILNVIINNIITLNNSYKKIKF